MTSLNRNIVASYASQAFVVSVGIAVTPLYLEYMGPEAYGLVGFFAVMQTWFGLLDLGLTSTIAREAARYHGGGLSGLAYRRLFRALLLIFVVVAALGGTTVWLSADAIASQWLRVTLLDHAQVVLSISLIGACVAVRWMGGLFRGVVSGAEQLVWLSAFNALVAALRFLGVFASMAIFGPTPTVFFLHQLAVNVLELGGLAIRCHRLLPRRSTLEERIGWSISPVKPMLQFAMTVALTSALWIAVTQSDKLILSGILELKEYGYFSVAVLVAGGITMITSPISVAITPRLARLHVEGQNTLFVDIYRSATRLVTSIVGTASITLVICAESALLAWTANPELAINASPIMQLYAVGNALLALAAFPFYIQYARGHLYHHVVGNLLLALILLPAAVFAAIRYGAVGAGWVWVVMNLLYLSLWVSYVHHKLVPGLHTRWVRGDIVPILAPLALVGLTIAWFRPILISRVDHLVFCILTMATLGLTAATALHLTKRLRRTEQSVAAS